MKRPPDRQLSFKLKPTKPPQPCEIESPILHETPIQIKIRETGAPIHVVVYGEAGYPLQKLVGAAVTHTYLGPHTTFYNWHFKIWFHSMVHLALQTTHTIDIRLDAVHSPKTTPWFLSVPKQKLPPTCSVIVPRDSDTVENPLDAGALNSEFPILRLGRLDSLFDLIVESCDIRSNSQLFGGSHLNLLFKLYSNPLLLETEGLLNKAISYYKTSQYVSVIDNLFELGARPSSDNLIDVARYAAQNHLVDLLLFCVQLQTSIATQLLPSTLRDLWAVQLLLHNGAVPRGKHLVEEVSRLIVDEKDDHMLVLTTLLESGLEINQIGIHDYSFLASAIKMKKKDLVKLFLRFGGNPNFHRCMTTAIAVENIEIIELLLEAVEAVKSEDVIEAAIGTNFQIFWRIWEKKPITDSQSWLSCCTVEMRQYLYSIDLRDCYYCLRAAIIEPGCTWSLLTKDMIGDIVKWIVQINIPFSHLPSETCAKLGWITCVDDNTIREKLTGIVSLLRQTEGTCTILTFSKRLGSFVYDNRCKFSLNGGSEGPWETFVVDMHVQCDFTHVTPSVTPSNFNLFRYPIDP